MVSYTKTLEALRGEIAVIAADVSAIRAKVAPVVTAPPAEPTVEPPPVVTPPPATPPAEPPQPVPTGSYTRPRRTGLPQIVKTPAQLAEARLVLRYANPINPQKYPAYSLGAYSSVGLTNYMPTAGEREELGLVTDAQAMWLCGGSPNNMLVQAEASADIPMHYGKVDIFASPNATTYSRGVGSPFFDPSGYPVIPDIAHNPSLCYVPYLATGDLYYLEELQLSATYKIIALPPQYRLTLDGGEPRGLAWTLRDIAACYLATPETVPIHLHTKAYWKRVLDLYRDEFKRTFLQSDKPLVRNAHVATRIDAWVAPWEQDYIGYVLGWMVWCGITDWRENYEWQIQQAIQRADFGPSAIGYHWLTKSDPTDMASLIAANPNDDKTDTSYKAYLRGDLKVAVLNNVVGAAEALAKIEGLAKDYITYKWAV